MCEMARNERFFRVFLHFSSGGSLFAASAGLLQTAAAALWRVCAEGTALDGRDGRQPVLKEVGLQKTDLIFT